MEAMLDDTAYPSVKRSTIPEYNGRLRSLPIGIWTTRVYAGGVHHFINLNHRFSGAVIYRYEKDYLRWTFGAYNRYLVEGRIDSINAAKRAILAMYEIYRTP